MVVGSTATVRTGDFPADEPAAELLDEATANHPTPWLDTHRRVPITPRHLSVHYLRGLNWGVLLLACGSLSKDGSLGSGSGQETAQLFSELTKRVREPRFVFACLGIQESGHTQIEPAEKVGALRCTQSSATV